MDEQEYNRIKNEYKEHFRKMRDLKKRVSEIERKKRLGDALQSLDTSAIMDSFDHLVDQVREKAAISQAKIELMLEQEDDDEDDFRTEEEFRKEEARKMIHDLKKSTAQSEENQHEAESNTEKREDEIEQNSSKASSKEVKKTIGPGR